MEILEHCRYSSKNRQKSQTTAKQLTKKEGTCDPLLSQARVECGQLLTLSKLQKTLASNKRSSSLFFKCVIHLIRFDMKLQYLDLNMKSDCKLEVTSGAIRSEKRIILKQKTRSSKFNTDQMNHTFIVSLHFWPRYL